MLTGLILVVIGIATFAYFNWSKPLAWRSVTAQQFVGSIVALALVGAGVFVALASVHWFLGMLVLVAVFVVTFRRRLWP